jgi:Peptidase_C39 like family
VAVTLDVPYISQLSPQGLGGNNCGPACLAMAMAYRGVIEPTSAAMLEVADIARDGLSDDRGETGGYTTFGQLAMVAAWYGQPTVWISSWEAVAESLDAQEPVILLLDNRVLQPRQYPNTAAFAANHFILLTGYDDAGEWRPSSDPLSVQPRGPSGYFESAVRLAVRSVGGAQGLALAPLERPPVPGEPPMPPEVYAMLNGAQRAAVQAALWGSFWNPEYADWAIPTAWRDEWVAGRYRGRPLAPEQPIPASEDRPAGNFMAFELGVCCWLKDVGVSWNG